MTTAHKANANLQINVFDNTLNDVDSSQDNLKPIEFSGPDSTIKFIEPKI